jgi:carbamate kinase
VRDGDGFLTGVEAVIDKDHASSVLARMLGVEALVIVTAISKVALNFGKPNQYDIDIMSVGEARRYLSQGEFPPGSMGPKIEAAIDFLEGGGKEVLITSHREIEKTLSGSAGTRIVP